MVFVRPVAGSKTDLRGRKAKTHICREILELCTVIHDVGTYKAQKRVPGDDGDDDIEDDGTIIVSFGELFQVSLLDLIFSLFHLESTLLFEKKKKNNYTPRRRLLSGNKLVHVILLTDRLIYAGVRNFQYR